MINAHPAVPDSVFFVADGSWSAPIRLSQDSTGSWSGSQAKVELQPIDDHSARLLLSSSGASQLVLRWATVLPTAALILGDAWERSYGDLQWRHLQPERFLPWFFLAHDEASGTTGGLGVDVQPGGLCSWTVDAEGISLWVDLRSGDRPTQLGARVLEVATIRRFEPGPDPWQTLIAATAAMATPIDGPSTGSGSGGGAVAQPVVGANNWYYAYGVGFDEQAVLGDARTIVELADGHPVRPFSVIDDGWNPGGTASGGPWDHGTHGLFDDLGMTASKIRDLGARPGIWFRPLLSRKPGAARNANTDRRGEYVLDPSTQAALDLVAADLVRFKDWGFDLVKHDFSSYDIFGQFGPAMGAGPSFRGHRFADRSRTTAEIIGDFYRAIRTAATDLVIIGCNTIGHLAAGLVDVQRVGDDTSGRHWKRTRRMGVNTLAFRLPQHGRFFTVDADCVPCTPQTPWELNRQFLELVARSGTALFLSIDPESRSTETDADLARAIKTALDGGVPGGVEPLDWLHTTTPTRWHAADREANYHWSEPWGSDPSTR